jgi:hypothetical protein
MEVYDYENANLETLCNRRVMAAIHGSYFPYDDAIDDAL